MPDDVRKLGEMLAQPEFRAAFLGDPDGTMRRYDIDPNEIPRALVDTLTSLSPDELEVVARVSSTLRAELTQDELERLLDFPI
jgi:hypothetical protein